jgi:hypothetical protein
MLNMDFVSLERIRRDTRDQVVWQLGGDHPDNTCTNLHVRNQKHQEMTRTTYQGKFMKKSGK